MTMETKRPRHNRQYGADPYDTGSALFVQPDDEVVPIREHIGSDGSRNAELGAPITARDLWKED